jgi:multidrug resistance efflux pump
VSTPVSDVNPRPESLTRDQAPRGGSQPTSPARSIRELEAELALALRAYDRSSELMRRHSISGEEWDLARGRVLVIAARLEGIDDDAQDELARLELELLRKQAELQRAQALEKAASLPVAFAKQLHANKVVSVDEVAKAEAELAVATAGVDIARAEVGEVKLRIRQLREREQRVRRVVAQAERVKKTDSPLPTPGPPAEPSRP